MRTKRAVVVTWGNWEWRLIDNRPVFTFSRGCWRYQPGDFDDGRRSFSRTRIGPWKVEIVRW